MEHKSFPFDVKDIDEETGIFRGHAATFSKKPDSYGDVIEKGAFTKTIKEMGNRVKILWNHHVLEPLGKPTELEEDDKGLRFVGKLSLGVQRAKEILTLMKDGVITEMSIGYETIKDDWEKVPGGRIRHLQEIKLFDISPVTFAANPEAVITSVKDEDLELKPYPNEHACRINPPGKYERFRRGKRKHEGKEYSVIYGKLKGEAKWEDQAYRYDIEIWEKDEARKHCKDHDGSFEAAGKGIKPIDEVCSECEDWKTHFGSIQECQATQKEDAEALGFTEVICPDQLKRGTKAGRVISAANIAKLRAALSAIQALLEAAEAENEPGKSTQLDEVAKEAAELVEVVNMLKAEREGFDVKDAMRRIEAMLGKIKQEAN